MDTEGILCKYLKLHTFDEEVFCNYLYSIHKCSYCNTYKVTYKQYEITNKYTEEQLPENLKQFVG